MAIRKEIRVDIVKEHKKDAIVLTKLVLGFKANTVLSFTLNNVSSSDFTTLRTHH